MLNMPCRISGDNLFLALFTKIHLQFVSPLERGVDRFLQLVRHLNTAALARKAHDAPQTHQAFAQVYQEMQQAVARMATLAGKTDAELAAEKAQEPLRRAV